MAGVTEPAIRVAIVDDDPLVREGLRFVLSGETDLLVVGEASDGLDAQAVIARTRPDVVLMDVRMPRCDGVTAARRELAARPDLAILMLTTFHADRTVLEALGAGAKGFLLKDAEPAELIDALRTAASGRSVLAPVVLDRVIELVAAGGVEDAADRRRFEALTGREREVALALARGDSNAQISRHLYISLATVKTHVSRVLDKLEVDSRSQAVAVLHRLDGVVR